MRKGIICDRGREYNQPDYHKLNMLFQDNTYGATDRYDCWIPQIDGKFNWE